MKSLTAFPVRRRTLPKRLVSLAYSNKLWLAEFQKPSILAAEFMAVLTIPREYLLGGVLMICDGKLPTAPSIQPPKKGFSVFWEAQVRGTVGILLETQVRPVIIRKWSKHVTRKCQLG